MIEVSSETLERISNILAGVPSGAERAVRSVVKRAANTAQNEAIRATTEVYVVNRQNVTSSTTIENRLRGTNDGVVGMITFAGYKLPLYRYNITPTTPQQKKAVRANIMRRRPMTKFDEVFIAQLKNGHVGAFERTTRARWPIEEKMGLAVPQMARNPEVLEKTEEKAQEVISKRVEQEITRILYGYGV